MRVAIEGISIKFISHCSLSLVPFFFVGLFRNVLVFGRFILLDGNIKRFQRDQMNLLEIIIVSLRYDNLSGKLIFSNMKRCTQNATIYLHVLGTMHAMCLIGWILSWIQMHILLYNKLSHGIFLRFLNISFAHRIGHFHPGNLENSDVNHKFKCFNASTSNHPKNIYNNFCCYKYY